VDFLKFSRDKRGYENFYLVEPAYRGKARPRVLYWFRTPPNVKVGRSPFDIEMRHAVETQNPGVAFDWDAIVRTPIPPPSDTERWRERRRVERAMRSAEDEAGPGELSESSDSSDSSASPPPDPPQAKFAARPAEPSADQAGEGDERPMVGREEVLDAAGGAGDIGDPGNNVNNVNNVNDVGDVEAGEPVAAVEAIGASNPLSPLPQGGVPAGTGQRRRRRRRRGRKPQAQGEV
jgi:hypothetical protein